MCVQFSDFSNKTFIPNAHYISDLYCCRQRHGNSKKDFTARGAAEAEDNVLPILFFYHFSLLLMPFSFTSPCAGAFAVAYAIAHVVAHTICYAATYVFLNNLFSLLLI